MPRLIMKRGPTLGATFELEGEQITVGRGSKNAIIIQDNEVSREHCQLVRVSDGYEVFDGQSSNGTFVNGQRVTTRLGEGAGWRLQQGALLELGDSITLQYERLVLGKNAQPPLFPDETTEARLVLDTAPADKQTDPLAAHRSALLMTLGPMANQQFELEVPIITVGRELTNDLVIQDPEVSRYHLRLRRMRAGYGIEDLGSTNGTLLNGKVLSAGKPRPLEHDDVITLGASVEMRYQSIPVGDSDNYPITEPMETPHPDAARDETLHTALIRGERRVTRTSALGTGLAAGALTDHLFLAYARSDWEHLIAPLTLGLEDAGVKVFVDQYIARGSDDWRAAFEQALIEARMMVVVLSPASAQDQTVKLAYRHFARRNRPILLLVTDSRCVLPPELENARLLPYEADNAARTLHRVLVEVM